MHIPGQPFPSSRPKLSFFLSRLDLLLAPLLLTVIGWVVWGPTAKSAYFYADDWEYFRTFVSQDYEIQVEQFLPWATDGHRPIDRAIKTILFLEFQFDSEPYHQILLTLHLITTCLIFILVRRVTSRSPPAWIAASIFLFNPFTVEVVAWISLLHDALVAVITATILLLHNVYSERTDEQSRVDGVGVGSHTDWVLFVLLVVLFLVGLKVKEGIAVLAVVLATYSFFFGKLSELIFVRNSLLSHRQKMAVLMNEVVKIAVLLGLTAIFYVSAPHFSQDGPTAPYYMDFRPSIISQSLWWYISQLFSSSTLEPGWIRSLPPTLKVFTISVIVLAPTILLKGHWRDARVFFLGWAIFWIGLLPTAVLPNHYGYRYYLYWPMLGMSIAIGDLFALTLGELDRVRRHRVWQSGLIAVGALLLAASTLKTLHSPVAQYYAAVGQESRHVMAALNNVLPEVEPESHIVIIGVENVPPFQYLTWYERGPSAVLQAWYQDSTVDVLLVGSETQIPASLRSQLDRLDVIVLKWTGDQFIQEDLD